MTRIEVDKTRQTVKAFDADGKLLAFFPASVGSADKPTPSGTLKVTSVQRNPTYRYDPEYKFKGVKARRPSPQARTEQSGRLGLDRAVGEGLWHPRHGRALAGQQVASHTAACG